VTRDNGGMIPTTYQNQIIPPVPAPSPSPARTILSTTSKTLPTVTHIPILTFKTDFFAWDEAVNCESLIRANNLLGHIQVLDPSAYVDPTRPDLAPTPPPVLTITSSARDIDSSNRWWADDNIAQHILLSGVPSWKHPSWPSSSSGLEYRYSYSFVHLQIAFTVLQHFQFCRLYRAPQFSS
jgi:hypothetical protein